ncbi:N-acetyltransferase [Shouchella shacheensis]|uniref:N-acetyltransferase n=1 Tax=Shouchella shacheensis TaxID=1649580 RepID=UPI0007405699|nr:N-acetyltransferase [Shouchella shacheensis]
MVDINVERLLINYKTLEEFRNFREYGAAELSMKDDLNESIVENDSESPFYGIYFGKKLVARMSLYRFDGNFDRYFEPAQDYLELWKLEVLEPYRGKEYGRALVNFAKSLDLPIKTNARQSTGEFWAKLGFEPATYNESRDRGESPYIWFPKGVQEQKLNEEPTQPVSKES